MDESDDLTGGPYLIFVSILHSIRKGTYAKVLVAVQEHLSASLSTDVFGDLLELARRASLFDIHSLERDLVRKESRGVLPPPEYERSVRFLRIDNGLLDVVVDRRLDGAHEPRSHVDTTRSESKRSSQSLTICEPSRGDKWHTQRLSCPAQQDKVGDIRLANMTGALESIDGQEIDAQFDRRLCVPNCGAFV